MTDEIRQQVQLRLRELGLSQADLARQTELSPTVLNRALLGRQGGGMIPITWEKILAALDLELHASPREKA